MKYLRWLSLGTALALCLCIAAPLTAHAASTSVQTKSRKASVKKQGKAAKKTASRAKDKRHAKKSVKSGKARLTTAKNNAADRDLWLKRAQQGELLSGKASWYGPDFHSRSDRLGDPTTYVPAPGRSGR